MDLTPWIPSVMTTSLLGIALWLGRNVIKTRLTNAVAHEFNTKLEAMRSEFRQREELLKADLRSKEADIAALRAGVMNAMASRQMAIDKRRLDAIDQLWAAVTALAPAKVVSSFMAVFNFEATAAEAARNRQFRQLFEAMGTSFDLKSLDLSGAAKARPFVSSMAWALYSAYSAICGVGLIKLQILKSGVEGKDWLRTDVIAKLVRTALPHRSASIDQHGDAAYYGLLDELEQRLLEEFRKMLAGEETDKAGLERAAEILKLSTEISGAARESGLPPNITFDPTSSLLRPPGSVGGRGST